jgi:hypothetical protein
LKLVSFAHLKKIKTIVDEQFSGSVEKLRPIKDILEEQ